jgi:Rrf2 family protein
VKLQAKTRYGVRAVFDLAFHNAAGATQAKDIARREGIPLRYLEQIFQDLKRAGIVDSRRGPRGGYTLKRPPETIRLGDVVRALQGPLDAIFSPEDEVDGKRRGRGGAGTAGGAQLVTASLWRELATHVSSWFDQVSLADLVRRGMELGVPRGDKKPPMYFI